MLKTFTPSQLLDQLNAHLEGLRFPEHPQALYTPISYILSLGGKRIRPVLMLMAYNLYREDPARILDSAAAVEVYHNYTLLHDDLMDRADKRRGKATVHRLWGDNAAILSGDAMLVLAYRLLETGPENRLKELLTLFSQTALAICEGQQLDMDFEQRNDVTEAEYVEMIRLKTAVLLAAALQMGALLAEAPQGDASLLYQFGVQLGIAFQLQDDLLDVYGDPVLFGKNIGGDILSNKKTYLLIKALEYANEEQRARLDGWLALSQFDSDEKIKAVTQLYDEIGVKALCENLMQQHYLAAMENLAMVAVSESLKGELSHLAKALMHRAH